MSAQPATPRPDDDQRPDGYYIANSGTYDEEARTVAHRVQVSIIANWLGTTQIRRVHFRQPDVLALSTTEAAPARRRYDHDSDQLVATAATA